MDAGTFIANREPPMKSAVVFPGLNRHPTTLMLRCSPQASLEASAAGSTSTDPSRPAHGAGTSG